MDPLESPLPAAELAPRSTGTGNRIRRTIATLFLAGGLLAVGGVAAVSAASPTPSAASSPSTSGGTTTTPAHNGNCPGM
jgi:hypothetical protein